MKYHPELVKKARSMHAQGYSQLVIQAELGFESLAHIRYIVDPKRREQQRRHTEAWQKANPEKWREIANRASRNYRARLKLKQ